jgi:Rho-binding antiterminator
MMGSAVRLLLDADMSDYTPIDCHLYSRYELAILQRRKLRVAWRDPDGLVHLETVLPANLVTREHTDMIVNTGDGLSLEIRLDRIIRALPSEGDCL